MYEQVDETNDKQSSSEAHPANRRCFTQLTKSTAFIWGKVRLLAPAFAGYLD